jgi:hypothetical protein
MAIEVKKENADQAAKEGNAIKRRDSCGNIIK